MKKLVISIVSVILLTSCESELQVYTDDFTPMPIVYCLINPNDTVHTIRLSKSIPASIDPDEQKDDRASFVFPEASITVWLFDHSGDSLLINPVKVEESDKNSGYFGNETHDLYQFHHVMSRKFIALYSRIKLEINIPDYPTVKGSSDILFRPRIRWPHIYQKYLFVDHDRPLLVQWPGSAWNEVDIQFDIMEQYRDSTVTQSYIFEEKTNILMKEGVCEVTFPYELIVQNLVHTLDPRKDLVRRYFGPVLIQVHTGNEEFALYMDIKDGINNFNGNTFSNLENALGFVGCNLSYRFDTMHFDYLTRQRFAADPELLPFKFKEY